VRFHDGTQLRSYLTNVLDPRQLCLPDIARLYARRWDIELAFLTLKDLLHLHH
jgi:IS4 transposase